MKILQKFFCFLIFFGISTAWATTSSVVPVYYIPNDATIYSGANGQRILTAHLETIRKGLRNATTWYSRVLPNKNIAVGEIRIYYGQSSAAQCRSGQSDCIHEVSTALNLPAWSSADARQKLLVLGYDWDGWAGGAGDNQGNGYAGLSVTNLIEPQKCGTLWWCNQDMWIGALIHELGHAFGLPHNTDTSSIMTFHGEWRSRTFTADEIAQVEIDPAALPKLSNWAACDVDFQCATKRCGGNGSKDMVCLPTSAYSKSLKLVEDGTFCRSNAECRSKNCATNPLGERACARNVAPYYPENP